MVGIVVSAVSCPKYPLRHRTNLEHSTLVAEFGMHDNVAETRDLQILLQAANLPQHRLGLLPALTYHWR